jgi:hypothetical protein
VAFTANIPVVPERVLLSNNSLRIFSITTLLILYFHHRFSDAFNRPFPVEGIGFSVYEMGLKYCIANILFIIDYAVSEINFPYFLLSRGFSVRKPSETKPQFENIRFKKTAIGIECSPAAAPINNYPYKRSKSQHAFTTTMGNSFNEMTSHAHLLTKDTTVVDC